ncbi:MAG: carbon-nitrogen hydrolase family protein [Chloroflexi bacterium]|nr:MAG: carbon-nitrogen hydrolase family protein [Chloroflexota bacterium]
MREVVVAAVQMAPRLNEMEENLVAMSEWIRKIATEQRVDLILFPELVTTGRECGVRFTEFAQRVPGPTVNLIAQRASEFNVHVAFGLVTKQRVESILYNTAVLIGPDGDLIGEYHKVHLRGEERMTFRTGYRYLAMETNFGVVGLMLGWDLAFPEVARCLALEGAELLAVLANWETDQMEEWRTYLLARAYENTLFVAGANRVGEEPSYSFGGDSAIVGPRGQVYASLAGEMDPETGRPTEGYIVARLDLDEVRRYREEFQVFQCREPQTYRAIVRKY